MCEEGLELLYCRVEDGERGGVDGMLLVSRGGRQSLCDGAVGVEGGGEFCGGGAGARELGGEGEKGRIEGRRRWRRARGGGKGREEMGEG